MNRTSPTKGVCDELGTRPLWGPAKPEANGRLSRAKRYARRVLQGLGYDVQRYRQGGESFEARRSRLMKEHRIDLVLDVGANVGQYAGELRGQGYRGRIVSFEPLSEAFSELRARAASDPAWECARTALGETAGEAVIHVAGNSYSSSLLPMTDLHLKVAPESAYVGDEKVPITPLHAAVADYLIGDERILLKLDVQGYELDVLRGAEEALSAVCLIETEMSTRTLYDGQPLWDEVVQFLAQRGFQLSIAHELLIDADTGHLLQLDGGFARSDDA